MSMQDVENTIVLADEALMSNKFDKATALAALATAKAQVHIINRLERVSQSAASAGAGCSGGGHDDGAGW